MIMARSFFSASLFASFRYMNTVRKGACPLVVIRVITWYSMVWTPFVISFFSLLSTISSSTSLGYSKPTSFISWSTSARIFSLDTWTKGARCAREILCPPYWLLATCAMICVAMLHAVEKL